MDITGFNEQIGFLPKFNLPKINFRNPFPKNLPQTNFLKKIAQQARPNIKPTVKPSGGLNSLVKKAMQQGRPQTMPISPFSKSAMEQMVRNAQAKGLIPKTMPLSPFSKAGIEQMVRNAQAKGLIKKTMPLSPFSKTAMEQRIRNAQAKGLIKPSFNLVPTASKAPTNFFKRAMQPIKKDEVKRFENTLQAMPASQQAKAIFNLPPTPAIVKNLTPTQRSFLKTDLPYQVISKNNFGQPTTKVIKNTPFKFNINIDQIQPPIDGGIKNYYGK